MLPPTSARLVIDATVAEQREEAPTAAPEPPGRDGSALATQRRRRGRDSRARSAIMAASGAGPAWSVVVGRWSVVVGRWSVERPRAVVGWSVATIQPASVLTARTVPRLMRWRRALTVIPRLSAASAMGTISAPTAWSVAGRSVGELWSIGWSIGWSVMVGHSRRSLRPGQEHGPEPKPRGRAAT